jgi:hypothetical protein
MSRLCILPSRSGLLFFRSALSAALFLCFLAHGHPTAAQQPTDQLPLLAAGLPDAPTSQSPAPQIPAQIIPAQITPAAITGTITDSDGAAIAGARIALTRGGQSPVDNPQPPPDDAKAPIAISTRDGRFTFPSIPPGPFQLCIAAAGFTPRQVSGELHPGETRDLPAVALSSAATTSIQVTASQAEIAEAQIKLEEKQRVLGVFPNFYVSYIPDPVPLTPKQKFELAFKNMVDPVNFVLTGVAAGAEQANNTYAWGQGAQGYAKRYAAAYGTFLDGTLIGNAALPVLLKQDPRYFYKGTGSIHSRALYAAANAVICKGDNHHWQPNYSAILGSLAASGISNLYYPAPNRSGAGVTFEGAAIGTGMTAIFNLIQEFAVRKLTPHVPPPASLEPASQQLAPAAGSQ